MGKNKEHGKGPTQKMLPLELPILPQPTFRVRRPELDPVRGASGPPSPRLARRMEGDTGAYTWKGVLTQAIRSGD